MIALTKGVQVKMNSLLLTRVNAVAETIALHGREYLSDVETFLLEFQPDFRRMVEDNLRAINGSNGATLRQPVELLGG